MRKVLNNEQQIMMNALRKFGVLELENNQAMEIIVAVSLEKCGLTRTEWKSGICYVYPVNLSGINPDGSKIKMNTIYYGECLDVLRQMPDASVDMFFQDLPYNCTDNEWDERIYLSYYWDEWLRVGKESCVYVFTAQQPFTTELINSKPKYFRYDIVWHKNKKTNFANANRMPMRAHESVLIFYRKLPTYNPQKTAGTPYFRERKEGGKTSENYRLKERSETNNPTGERHPGTVLSIPVVNNSKHPTEKPVPLVEWFINTYTNKGEVVFDGFAGSGSTGEAAIHTGRRFVLVEKNKKYYHNAIERLKGVKP